MPHHDTPSVVHLDHLGRSVRSVAHNRRAGAADEFALTRSVLDVQGNVLEVIDARGNVAESRTYVRDQAMTLACGPAHGHQ